jgi:hypothetical protein
LGERPRSIQTASRKRDTAGSAESALEVMAIAVLDKPSLAAGAEVTAYAVCGPPVPSNVVTSVW